MHTSQDKTGHFNKHAYNNVYMSNTLSTTIPKGTECNQNVIHSTTIQVGKTDIPAHNNHVLSQLFVQSKGLARELGFNQAASGIYNILPVS